MWKKTETPKKLIRKRIKNYIFKIMNYIIRIYLRAISLNKLVKRKKVLSILCSLIT